MRLPFTEKLAREYEPTIFRVGLALFLTDIANK